MRPSLTDLLSRELLKEGSNADTLGSLTEENPSSTGEATAHQDPGAAEPSLVTIKAGRTKLPVRMLLTRFQISEYYIQIIFHFLQ